MKELPTVLQKVRAEKSGMSIAKFFRNNFPVLFGRPRIGAVPTGPAGPMPVAPKATANPTILCIGRIHRGRMTMVAAFPRKGAEGDGKQIRKDQGGQDHDRVS